MNFRLRWRRTAACVAIGCSILGCGKPAETKPKPETVEKLKSPDEAQRDAGIDDVQKEYGKKP